MNRVSIAKSAFERHNKVVGALPPELFERVDLAGEWMVRTLKARRRLYACGNGGSAADAQHFAAEFVGRYQRERRGLPAHALTTDTSALTAIGNDYGYERVFARQLEALAEAGDLLLAISTSGTSRNVLAAVNTAGLLGMKTVLLLGDVDWDARQSADVLAISVPAKETARIQEIHILIIHALCEYVDVSLAP